MLIDAILLLVSLVVLTAGAEGLVKGSSSMAIKLGITPLVVGLTVVAFGTSSPELVVSVTAAWKSQADIAFGNVIGSNIFNIGIILGLTALICPVAVHRHLVQRDGVVMLITALLVLLFGGTISRPVGIALFIGVILYTTVNVVVARREARRMIEEIEKEIAKKPAHVFLDIAFIVGGLILLVIGSRMLVTSAVDIARALEVSEAIIGLTIIAAGTSMPELATSVVAALRREPDIAVGNIIGSCIFNVLAILGLASTVFPIVATKDFTFDIWVMIAFSALVLPLLYSKLRLERWEGGVLLLGYMAYLAAIWPK